jgi:sulfur carrier protein
VRLEAKNFRLVRTLLALRPLPHAYRPAYDASMQVQLSHPARTVEVKGPKKVKELLRDLNLVVEAHLVIKGDDLVTEDEMLYDGDQIEIRPVISGGD